MNIQTGGGHFGGEPDRRETVKEQGGGVVELTQMAPDEREKFVKAQVAKAEQEAKSCCQEQEEPVANVSCSHVYPTEAETLKNMCATDPHPWVGPPTLRELNTVIVPIVAEDEFVPKYQTDGAACADLIANTGGGVVTIPSRTVVVVNCAIQIALPEGWEMQLRPRSGLAKRGLTIVNSPSTVDDDFRGEIQVVFGNIGKEIIKASTTILGI